MRTFLIAALFACCAGGTSRADVPADPPEAGQPTHPASPAPTAGDVGATNVSTPGRGTLTCRRYFGCVPGDRATLGLIKH